MADPVEHEEYTPSRPAEPAWKSPPRPADLAPRPGKQNKGNRRTGGTKGTHSGTRRGQLTWRKDPLVMDRLNMQRSLSAQGYSISQMLNPINQMMVNRGAPEVTLWTIQEDARRLRQIREEEAAAAKDIEMAWIDRHIESLTEVKQQAWRAFHTTGNQSLNRSAYLNTVRAVEETIARLKGSFAPEQIEVGRSQAELEAFRLAIEQEIPDEDVRKRIAVRVLRSAQDQAENE